MKRTFMPHIGNINKAKYIELNILLTGKWQIFKCIFQCGIEIYNVIELY